MIHRMPTAEKAASAPVPASAPAMPWSTWILVPKPKNPIAPTTAATSPTSPALAADHRDTTMRKTMRASGAVATKAAIQLSVIWLVTWLVTWLKPQARQAGAAPVSEERGAVGSVASPGLGL